MTTSHPGEWSGEIVHDRYAIQQLLGKRAGRRSLLARDLHTQSLVVLKLLLFNDEFEWDDLKLFEREAETLRSLDHPAIPAYVDSFELDLPRHKGFALVQTYISAKSLEEHLKAGRSFSEADIQAIAKALLEILTYLHRRQPPVIHRDLKPSNVLLGDRSGSSVGQVYLVDFGSVQTLAAKEGGTLTVVGTYGYMPPEQFGGRATPASDLYSLGATLIYLSSGKHPADLPQADLRLQFESAVQLAPPLVSWLKQMVEPSVDRRFTSAQVALLHLEQLHLGSLNSPAERPTLNKSARCRIQVKRSADPLEVLVLAKGMSGQDYQAMLLIVWLLFFAWKGMPTLSLLALGAASLPMFGLLVGGAAAIGYYALQALYSPFGRMHLTLSDKQMSIGYELFGVYYEAASIAKGKISRIQHTKRFFRPVGGGFSQAYAQEPAHLIVWVGRHKRKLCSAPDLTEAELSWLAQELSRWSGLAVDRQ